MRSSLLVVTVGGAIVLAIGVAIGSLLSAREASLAHSGLAQNPLVHWLFASSM